ncbi:hypothetical protein EJ110_NYTH08080 [Nymphaea thermarum]|nr:hypothetical protein EJ110_NYTH08080 [Nymphaea thermarum]
MRIRNSRSSIDVLAAVCSSPSSSSMVPPLCSSLEKPQAAAPEVGVCLVNQSPWDVTPLVLAFFHVDGLLPKNHHDGRRHRQVCAGIPLPVLSLLLLLEIGATATGDATRRVFKREAAHELVILPGLSAGSFLPKEALNWVAFILCSSGTKALAQEASASKERNGGSRSDPLSPSISSFKSAGKDGRKGKGKQEEKRSDALCFKSEGSAPETTTIHPSLQNSRRRAAKKGEEEGSAAAKDSRSGGVKGRTCKREDGKGWRCSNEAAPGSSLCEHHLSQVRSYCKRPSTDSRGGAGKLQPNSTGAGGGEGRRKRPMSSSSSSMGSFYYYAGFGPAWRETKRKRVSAVAEDDGHTVEDEEEEEDDEAAAADDGEDDGKGKSRGRKRVKCRSLKSLL